MFLVYNLILFISILSCLYINNWLVLWVLVELSTMMVVLIISEGSTPRAIEAASKYFVVQAVASGFLLMGILSHFFIGNSFIVFGNYDLISYCLILLGVFVKLAVLPNPFWFVDVVSGVSLYRAFYVIVASKVVPVYLFISLSSQDFLLGLCLVGLLSVFLGSVLGVNQISIRKILAFSSIAHMGWMISCFPILSYWCCVVLFFCYLLMLFPIFFVSSLCSIQGIFKQKNSQFQANVGLVVIVSLLSLGGLPPLVGFFYKWLMLLGLTGQNLFLVAGILILMSVISLYYYLSVCYSVFSVYWAVPQVFCFVNVLVSNSFFFFLGVVSLVNVLVCIFLVGPIIGVWFL
uniref:NADH-ubiquinone oxidoreductase chain 2 n=1 Tax=Ophiomastix mixta TaxID=2705303 RepID=A0A6C0FGH1_9ECHI|nr:NADH dehydrogenase subunit 2 [Ophiomastix mixta]QHT54193.1 NADH dehydrogenase subunit 2 [Ophiomastix mixta]